MALTPGVLPAAYLATACWSMTPRCGSTRAHSMDRRKALQWAFLAKSMSSSYLLQQAVGCMQQCWITVGAQDTPPLRCCVSQSESMLCRLGYCIGLKEKAREHQFCMWCVALPSHTPPNCATPAAATRTLQAQCPILGHCRVAAHLFHVSGQVCSTLYLPLNLLKPMGRAAKGKLLLMKFVQLLSSSPEFCHMEMATPLWNTSSLSCLPLVLGWLELSPPMPLACCCCAAAGDRGSGAPVLISVAGYRVCIF